MGKQNSFGFEVPVKVHADDPGWMPKYEKGKPRNEVAQEIAGFVQGYKETSREAYRELIDTGALGKQEQKICKALEDGESMTLKEIANKTGIGIEAVSGRVNTLKQKKVLVETQKRACRVTGRNVTPVKAVTPTIR